MTSLNKTFIRKSTLAVAGLLSLLSTGIMAKEQSYNRAQKEIKIMSTIFETSLAELSSNNNRLLYSKKTKGTYLAKQGMVFNFNFGSNAFGGAENWESFEGDWESFGEGIGQLVGGIASEVGLAINDAIVAPEAPNVDIDLEERMEAYAERVEALEQMRENHNSQREEVREIQRELRRIEREKDSEENAISHQKRLKKELEGKAKLLKDKMTKYKKSMAEYRKKRDEKRTQSTIKKSDIIVSTLCDYGATLRSLKNDEHITLIFGNYAGSKDQVYVFDFDDVRSCESKDKLLKQAISYQI